jgi:transposase
VASFFCRKHGLGSISKQGDRYLRSLFTAGALAVIRRPFEGASNRALSMRADKLHSTDAVAAVPGVAERYQYKAETQSRGDH